MAKLKRQWMDIEMPDVSVWSVPVEVIARHRAENYKDEFGDDVERSLQEDTIPLFNDEEYEIEDWASNNMNWSDVKSVAVQKDKRKAKVDFQEGWFNGDKSFR